MHGQVVLWTRTGATQVRVAKAALRSEQGEVIPAECVKPAFVRYVLADRQIVPDVLDDSERLDIPARSVRPVWVSVDVPAAAKPGKYRGQVVAEAQGNVRVGLPLEVEVLPRVLPPAAEWKFRLDLWQNPFAVARYHHVAPWSPEHIRLLEPHLKLLASAGQKCITTTITWQPWGTQTYDPYDTMVQWTRRRDGKWAWDYGVFDKYVELCQRCGITDSISCYTIRGARFRDEKTGDDGFTGGPVGAWQPVWETFLRDFVAHLKQKGWLGRTAIAMDEWPMDSMKPAIAFIRKTAPELKIALAGSNEPRLKDDIDDWCVFIAPPLDPAIARERAAKGRTTTFYVCCGPGKPNTFTFSPPAEAAWLGWYAAAKGYSGLLRWAYDSFVQDPLYDTSFVTWPAGDCFLVYPGARSSIRFERLKEGIQDFEKVRILRQTVGKDGLKGLEEALMGFDSERVQREAAAEVVDRAKKALEEAGR